MLALLSLALVLAATVLLVVALVDGDGLALVYASIASSVAAGMVMMVARRRNRSKVEAKLPPQPRPEPELVEELDFPIADYDDLTVGQILPLLPQLYAHEIGVVADRERATKGRAEVLGTLVELGGDSVPTAVPTVDARSDAADGFPIEGYAALSATQIQARLDELDPTELRAVRDREVTAGRRTGLLDEIDRRLEVPSPSRRLLDEQGAGQEEGRTGQEGTKR